MGNKLGRRRSTVDERYTRPQGLYQHRDIDHRKLRRLILDSKLAPCYAGAEDPAIDLDECPICFLHYPSLNRSKCCTKGICTECFLQMKSPHSVRPTQCPYCKTLNYAVEYRGIKSEEEKGIEQVEEQKVIEAKIRMQQKELEEEHRQSTHGQLQTEYVRDSSTALEGVRSTQGDGISTTVGYQTAGIMPAGTGVIPALPWYQERNTLNNRDRTSEDLFSSNRDLLSFTDAFSTTGRNHLINAIHHDMHAGSGQGSTVPSSAYLRHNRWTKMARQSLSSKAWRSWRVQKDEFNIDLEDIMVMEAIWLSIQEQEESQRHFEPNLQGPLSIDISSHCASAQGRNTNYSMEGQANVVNPGDASERSSLTGGLAGVIAKLAERHVTGGSSPETQSFDPADGFGSFGTHTDFQLERPPTNDDVELGEELNEVFEDPRNPMTSLERNTDTLDDDNDQLLKAPLEGSSGTERTHPCDMHASCCESDDIGKVDRDSSRYQEACPSSMSNQSSQKFSDEVLGARSEAVRPIETRICGDTTFFKLSSQGLTTAYEQAYDNPVEGGGMSLVPKNFEEQMRLAMALSLAEAQTESGFRLGEEGSCQILNNTS